MYATNVFVLLTLSISDKRKIEKRLNPLRATATYSKSGIGINRDHVSSSLYQTLINIGEKSPGDFSDSARTLKRNFFLMIAYNNVVLEFSESSKFFQKTIQIKV